MSLFALAVLGGIFLSLYLAAMVWHRRGIIHTTVLGLTLFFSLYVLCAMGLFVLDLFRLSRCVAVLDALLLLLCSIVAVLRKKRGLGLTRRVRWDLEDYRIPVVIALGGLVLVCVKNGFFGMGQDEGVYQTAAINLLCGLTKRQQDFAEYHRLPAELRENFYETVRACLVGYDLNPPEYPATVYDTTVSPVSGIYHGIPTYAALLALWARLFGISEMLGIQTVFYILSIFLVWFIMQVLTPRHPLCNAAACLMTAVSPIIIWVAKSSLTEGFLGLIILLFVYLYLHETHGMRCWFSLLPIAVFCAFHVSIYTVLPLFWALYLYAYIQTNKRHYALLTCAVLPLYLVSYFAMAQVQPFYTRNNYSPLFPFGISVWSLDRVIPIAVGGVLVLTIAGLCLVHKFPPRKKLAQRTWLIWVIRVLFFAPLLLAILRWTRSGDLLTNAVRSTYWGYACCLGIFFLGAGWILNAIYIRHLLRHPRRTAIFIMSYYLVIIYATFMRPEIQYFYYYGRYLAPFVPVLAIFCALAMTRLHRIPAAAIVMASLIAVSPFDGYLLMAKDDTNMEWNVLEEMNDYIQPGDAVIFDRESMRTVLLPVRAMTGCAVYPAEPDFGAQTQRLAAQYNHVFYCGTTRFEEDFMEVYAPIYANPIHISTDDNVSDRWKLIPLPLGVVKQTRTMTLYKHQTAQTRLTATENADKIEGIGALENGFSWTTLDETRVRCRLEPGRDYTLSIRLGCALPLDELGGVQTVELSINGRDFADVEIGYDNNGGTLTAHVPAGLIREGDDILTIRYPLWAAALAAPNDPRQLGLPIESIEFN